MGVQVRIVLYAADETTAATAARAAFKRIAVLDQIMSNYRSTSELMQLVDRAGGPPVPLSEELFTVLTRAQQLARLSDGAFDVTVGPLAALWRQARRTGTLPDPDTLAAAAARVGWRQLRLDAEAQTAQLLVPGMTLDLGGIAKGYAGDEALAVLRRHGITRALIELGGDIVIGAPPPGRDGWRIEIAHAVPAQQHATLAHAAISSSGDTEQYVVFGGRRYSHVVDPRTGLGLTNRIAATVVAPDGLTSDGLATLLTTLGPERGLPLIETYYPAATAYVRYADQ